LEGCRRRSCSLSFSKISEKYMSGCNIGRDSIEKTK
jgi:hypothetical protein